MLGALGTYLPTKEKVANSFRIRDALQTAAEMRPADGSVQLALGEWCFKVRSAAAGEESERGWADGSSTALQPLACRTSVPGYPLPKWAPTQTPLGPRRWLASVGSRRTPRSCCLGKRPSRRTQRRARDSRCGPRILVFWRALETSSRSSCTPTRRRSAVHEIVLQPSRVFSYIRRSTTTSGLGSASRARRWRVAEREGETIGERSRAVGMRRTRSSTFSLWRPPPDLRPRTRRASLATSSRAAQTRRPGARVRSSCPAPARPTLRSTDSLRRRDNTFGRGARRAALVARAAPVDVSDRQLRPRFAHRSFGFAQRVARPRTLSVTSRSTSVASSMIIGVWGST